MTLRRKTSPGPERFDRLVKQRPPKPLEEGDHLLYEHALRCYCKLCGKLLNWDSPSEMSYTETECCGNLYKLVPWTVKVHIEDVSSRPVLPKMSGSEYSDPATTLVASHDKELPSSTIPAALVRPIRRRCGLCLELGHTRSECPN